VIKFCLGAICDKILCRSYLW